MRAPTRTQESEDPAPYNAPYKQGAAKRPTLHPKSWSSAPTPIIIKEKMGKWQSNNAAILWTTAKMAAPPLNRNSPALRQPHPYQRLPRMH
jgi:hypothetical protein